MLCNASSVKKLHVCLISVWLFSRDLMVTAAALKVGVAVVSAMQVQNAM